MFIDVLKKHGKQVGSDTYIEDLWYLYKENGEEDLSVRAELHPARLWPYRYVGPFNSLLFMCLKGFFKSDLCYLIDTCFLPKEHRLRFASKAKILILKEATKLEIFEALLYEDLV